MLGGADRGSPVFFSLRFARTAVLEIRKFWGRIAGNRQGTFTSWLARKPGKPLNPNRLCPMGRPLVGGAAPGSPVFFSPPIRENGVLVTRKISGRIVGKPQGIFSVWSARNAGKPINARRLCAMCRSLVCRPGNHRRHE